LRRDPGTGELVRDDPLDRGPPLAAGEEGHRPINIFDAAARGAEEGLRVAATVGGLLIAFISLTALLNIILGAAGDLVGLEDLTFQKLLGHAFAQIAPKRRGSVARLGVRAVLAGTLANLRNAAVAGMFV
jgi:nucleoside permease NupC